MDIDNDDSSNIEWSHVEDIDEEMPDVTGPDNSDNHDSYIMDKNIFSYDDSLMTDTAGGRNTHDDSGR
ncbi:hypothetical protein ACJ73_06596 [Blastomyces percursus]|uniref:Uncharacterized protein n=1 Tax=Blastomyces percursus TaxID=1658174 RepID=A0A1J9R0R5_9EURO|nr:hypothetical protein ACJ73_06596 [Blastomyces percursus]